MKFKFCGNIDCPEWLISEITMLTKVTNIKLRIISNNLINCILNNGKSLPDLRKALEEMKFNSDDSSIIISVLEFIFKNSSKFEIEDIVLNQELQQLGLPQENADSISKVFKNQRENLKNKLKDQVFSFSKVLGVEHKVSYLLADDMYNFQVDEKTEEDDTEKVSDKEIKALDTKIDLILKIGNTSNLGSSNDKENYHLSTNKITLGKMINDLEKSLELIKKYKSS